MKNPTWEISTNGGAICPAIRCAYDARGIKEGEVIQSECILPAGHEGIHAWGCWHGIEVYATVDVVFVPRARSKTDREEIHEASHPKKA